MTDDVWGQRRTSFGGAAGHYANGRPSYPRETLEWCLPPEACTVLDLAAGTGILTGGLLDLALDVVSVEPLAEMRHLVPAGARVLAGTAEAIPLPDDSVDAVLVGQAWHWFDEAKALAECHRVLRAGGALGLLWNLLDTTDPLTCAVADVIEAEERTDMMLDDEGDPPFDDPDGSGSARFGPADRLLVRHSESYDEDRVVEYALSRSQAIIMPADDRRALADRLRAAVGADSFSLHWVCEAWRATSR